MKQKVLIHICCAPCSTSAVERILTLYQNPDLILFYYNPNISPLLEEKKRYGELVGFLKTSYGDRVYLERGEYDHDYWYSLVEPLKFSGEGGLRCRMCYYIRLLKTFNTAQKLNASSVTTTLATSPYKNFDWLSEIGILLSKRYGIEWFVEKWDYKRSIELSKKHGLYRQNYCGCEFSAK